MCDRDLAGSVRSTTTAARAGRALLRRRVLSEQTRTCLHRSRTRAPRGGAVTALQDITYLSQWHGACSRDMLSGLCTAQGSRLGGLCDGGGRELAWRRNFGGGRRGRMQRVRRAQEGGRGRGECVRAQAGAGRRCLTRTVT